MSDNQTEKNKREEELLAKIKKCREKAAWCRKEVEGLYRSIDDSCRDSYYWDTKDLISDRRSEAFDMDREAERLEAELARLQSDG